MKLIAIMPVRNEEWIIGFSARAALMWCDMLVCLNHNSTDNTRKILEELDLETLGRILIADSKDEGWPEMVHRQRCLDIARAYDATHIALIDADEVLCADSISRIRGRIEILRAGGCLNVAMHCMWRGLHQYRTDPGSVWSNRTDLALAFADMPRLEFAAAADGYQHHARAPRHSQPVRAPDFGVMHMQFADWRRLTAKHALYKIRERIAYPQKPVSQIESMYNLAMDERGIQVKSSPLPWFSEYRDLTKYIHFGQQPWQELEAQRLYAKHGAATFAGLTLFGVVR